MRKISLSLYFVILTTSACANQTINIDDYARANFNPPYTDWTPIVAAAIASFPTNNDFNGDGMGGEIVFCASEGQQPAPTNPGVYTFLTPMTPSTPQGYGIELNRAVKLRGCSGAPSGNSLGASQLKFGPGLGGVRVNYQNFPGNGKLGADGSLIEGLSLIGAGWNGGPSTAHGIFYNAAVTIRDVTIYNFPGDGLNTLADAAVTPPSSSSVSLIENVYAVGNGGNGSTTKGGDSNSILFLNFKSRGNKGWGVYESSFIGCQYVGGYVEGNLGGGVWANHASGNNSWFGFYIESGDAVVMGPGNSIFGGPLAEAARLAGSSATIFGANYLSAQPLLSGDGKSVFGIGNAFNDAKMFMGWKDNQETGGAWPFRFKNFGNGALGPDWGGVGQPIFALLNSRALKANGYPIDAAKIPDVAGNGGFAVRGFVMGTPQLGQMIWVGVGNAPPSDTTNYPVGSIIHNSGASNVGDPTMWMLVNRAGVRRWLIAGTLVN
jgi:hypothetical protein